MAGKNYCVTFGGDKVALIIRGKKDHYHEPGNLEQHADCALSNGSPVGFFGEGAGASASSGSISSGGSGSTGMGMDGCVYSLSDFKRKRPFYVDKATAKGYGMLSTVLFVQVSAAEAKKFDDFWASLSKAPGSFYILGWNCSTHASQAFREAGILSGGIPGLDTPNNLYKQLCVEKAGKLSVASGYVGFSSRGSSYDILIDEP